MSEKTITRELILRHTGPTRRRFLSKNTIVNNEKLITLSPLTKQFSLMSNHLADKNEKIKLTQRDTKINLNIKREILGDKKSMISQEIRNFSKDDPSTELDDDRPAITKALDVKKNFFLKSKIKTRTQK